MVIINTKAEVHAYWDRPAIQQRTETIGLLGKAGAFALRMREFTNKPIVSVCCCWTIRG